MPDPAAPAAGWQRPEVREALAAYVLSIADDELILGHRHSEWTGLAPDIESDVALSSIAQEEMGHARLFYEQVGALGGADPQTLAFARPPEQFRNARLVERANGDWGYSIIRLFLYDRADAVRLAVLADGRVPPLAELARTLRREEKYHLLYGEQWLRRLAQATDDSRRRMQEALDRAWSESTALFEPTPGQDRLAEWLPASAAEQLAAWQAAVVPILEGYGLEVPADDGSGAGGRAGRHSDDLRILLEEMTSVWRLEPQARW